MAGTVGGMRCERQIYGGRKMNIGDTIKCNDADDMIETMSKLLKDGIESEFLYEKDGIKGL